MHVKATGGGKRKWVITIIVDRKTITAPLKHGFYDMFWQRCLLSRVVSAARLTDKGTRMQQGRCTLSMCMNGVGISNFPADTGWISPNRLAVGKYRLCSWSTYPAYFYSARRSIDTEGLQKLVPLQREEQESCDLWIDFLRLMWKMSHKANIKVIIFLQGLTSNLCSQRGASPRGVDTYTPLVLSQCHCTQLHKLMFCSSGASGLQGLQPWECASDECF